MKPIEHNDPTDDGKLAAAAGPSSEAASEATSEPTAGSDDLARGAHGMPPVHVGAGVRFSSSQLDELADAAAIFGCQLLHVGMQGPTLQFVIDHPDGVDVDHCADVSRQISALLDRDDFGSRRYVLEVSSPGIERHLYWLDDFRRFVGEKARITLRTPQGGKRTVQARIVSAEDLPPAATGEVTVAPEDGGPTPEDRLTFSTEDVIKAHLLFEA